MKIAVDMRMSGKSGIGTFIDSVLPFLTEDKSDEFLLLAPEEKPEWRKPNVRFIKCSIPMFSIKEMFFFPKDLLREINSCNLYFTPYCNIPGGIKVPVVSTIHDIVFLDVKGLSSPAGCAARKFFYRRCIKKSKKILTVSEFSRSRIIEKLKCKKEISVVYNGVPAYIEEKSEKPEPKENSILFIGNIKKHKGLKTLLLAHELIKQKLGEKAPVLTITGSRENFRTEDKETSELLKKNTEENKTVFTGFVSDEKIKSLIMRAKVLVQPSLYEGFGIPPLQALKLGTRAVISDIPVFKEIYGDFPVTFFECGNEKDLADKLITELSKPTLEEKIPDRYSYRITSCCIKKSFLI
ncbi:MAG: glycosyltransferase family 4 protein [Treponema sp.]|nr:glycosyltransferase family 4 protein [Treponema sp.]